MTATPLSGRQHTLRAGRYAAQVASVGATLRSLTADGRDLVVPFAAEEVRPRYRGATLAPWPNRVVDGRYAFGGSVHQLDLSEPERGHALHGLALWLDFELVDCSDAHVILAALIQPRPGYPWRIRIEVTYALAADGLSQTVRARNLTATAAPFGTGPHPYLVAGPGALDDWTLQLPAGAVLEVRADRLVPVGLRSVESDAARFDFRTPRRLGDVQIDHAFTALAADAQGRVSLRLTDPSGTGVQMSWGPDCPWVQIHTADLPGTPGRAEPSAAAEPPGEAGHRAGLAVEPMTCAPDAFNAARYRYDAGLAVLAPGRVLTASWRISAR